MADEMDKFVLQYQVDLKDAIEKLEKLNQKVEKNKKEGGEAATGLKRFAKDASTEISKLIPGVDRATSAVTGLGKGFSLAAAAVAVLGVGIKSVMDLREQYAQQRQAGMDLGMSTVRVEDYQRKIRRVGGGNITRDQVLSGIQAVNDRRAAAYADPTRMGNDARVMNMLGIEIGKLGDKPRSTNDVMTQIATKMRNSSEKDAIAMGSQLGLSQDMSKAIRTLGPSIGKITDMSENEVRDRMGAHEELDKFNKAMADLNEQFKIASNTLAEKLLPAITSIVEKASKYTANAPLAMEAAKKAADNPWQNFKSGMGATWDWARGKDGWNNSYMKRMEVGQYNPENVAKENQRAKDKQEAEKRGEKTDVDAIVDKADENNRDAKAATDQLQLAVAMFSGAVSSFANAVDERQAWAAWAGEVGKASGLEGPSSAASKGLSNDQASQKDTSSKAGRATTAFDSFFDEAAKKYKKGAPASLLKQIAMAESSMNPNAVSSVGAEGLMQIMPENSKKFGAKDPKDARTSIMSGARIMEENLVRAKGDVRTALMMYHGGLDRSNWGPKTLAYPDKVLNQGVVSSRGESKANINLTALQNNVASRLGVPVQQVQQGGINRGDVTWTLNQKDAELQNKVMDLNKQSKMPNLPKTEYARIAREMQETQMGLETLRRYRGGIEEKAKEGGRSITEGQIQVTVNVTASGKTLEEYNADIKNTVSSGVRQALNEYEDGKKL